MTDPNFIILYVDSPAVSAGFYTDLLEKAPLESSSTFAMFALKSGVMFGLWSKHTVEPPATATGGGELAFSVADKNAVHALHIDWMKRGLVIVQAPTEMDFGYTFVASDPDGYRLRVFSPSAS
jgi:predicted enzyme related to lactoylglutathione lyase